VNIDKLQLTKLEVEDHWSQAQKKMTSATT
jgi:hypothetical protein